MEEIEGERDKEGNVGQRGIKEKVRERGGRSKRQIEREGEREKERERGEVRGRYTERGRGKEMETERERERGVKEQWREREGF